MEVLPVAGLFSTENARSGASRQDFGDGRVRSIPNRCGRFGVCQPRSSTLTRDSHCTDAVREKQVSRLIQSRSAPLAQGPVRLVAPFGVESPQTAEAPSLTTCFARDETPQRQPGVTKNFHSRLTLDSLSPVLFIRVRRTFLLSGLDAPFGSSPAIWLRVSNLST